MKKTSFVSYSKSESVTNAVQTRRSLRAFLSTEIPVDTVSEILQKAARAPSGTNMQPWNAHVVTGNTRDRLCGAVCLAFDSPNQSHQGEKQYYPDKWFEPFISRRRKVGWDLYGLVGIAKGDKDRMHAQHRRNFMFFDAPVGIIFTIHRDLSAGSLLDYGMFLQNVMLLARESGLHSCPQAAWSDYHKVIREVLPVPTEEIVVCGMALGYANPDAPENTLVTDRVNIEQFVQFYD